MKTIKTISVFLIIGFVAIGVTGCVTRGPTIPKESIPADIPADVREQIERLYSSDPGERKDAAWTLGEMGKEAVPAIPFLIEVLEDYNLSVRGNAVSALCKIGTPAVEPLITALEDESSLVRRHAALALGRIGDPYAVEPLIAVLKDEDYHVRKNAAWALGEIGEKFW